ncbi:MAG: tetratricopeptide (TPR) repeat protein, partial [Candidatus Marinamargulisbacteria bacterium]
PMRSKLRQSKDFHIGIQLLKEYQFHESLDRLKNTLLEFPDSLPDILIPMYKQLIRKDELQIRLVISELYIFAKKYSDAVNEIEIIFENDPHFTQIYFLLSKIYHKNGQNSRIQGLMEAAFDKKIYDPAILDLLPSIYLGMKDTEKSIRVFEKLVEFHPEQIHHLKSLAELYKSNKNFEKAIDIYHRILEQSPTHLEDTIHQLEALLSQVPTNPKLKISLASMKLSNCDLDMALKYLNDVTDEVPDSFPEAQKLYKQALKQFPENTVCLIAYAKKLTQFKNFSESIQHLHKVAKITDADNPALIKVLRDILHQAPNQCYALEVLAEVQINQEQFQEAIVLIERIIELSESATIEIENKITLIEQRSTRHKDKCQFLRAKLFFANKDTDACIVICNQLIQESEDPTNARLLLSRLFLENQRFLSAKKELFKALEKAPYEWEAHRLAKSLQGSLMDKEIDKFDSLVTARSENSEMTFKTGMILLRKGEFDQATELFQKISEFDSFFLKSQILVCRCFMEMSRFDLSLNQLKRLLSSAHLKDKSIENSIRFLIGLNFIYTGNLPEAIKYFESILETDINFSFVKKILDYYKGKSFVTPRGQAMSACLSTNSIGINLFAVDNTETDIELSKKNIQALSFGHSHNHQGIQNLFNQNFQAAEDAFKIGISMDPQLTVLFCNYAVLKIILKEYDQAADLLSEAEKLNPNLDVVYLNRGLLFLKTGQYIAAGQQFQKAVRLNPHNILAKLNLGDVYFLQKDIENAILNWRPVLNLGVYNHQLQRRVGYLFPESLSFSHWITNFESVLADLLSLKLAASTQSFS